MYLKKRVISGCNNGSIMVEVTINTTIPSLVKPRYCSHFVAHYLSQAHYLRGVFWKSYRRSIYILCPGGIDIISLWWFCVNSKLIILWYTKIIILTLMSSMFIFLMYMPIYLCLCKTQSKIYDGTFFRK